MIFAQRFFNNRNEALLFYPYLSNIGCWTFSRFFHHLCQSAILAVGVGADAVPERERDDGVEHFLHRARKQTHILGRNAKALRAVAPLLIRLYKSNLPFPHSKYPLPIQEKLVKHQLAPVIAVSALCFTYYFIARFVRAGFVVAHQYAVTYKRYTVKYAV